MTPVGGTEGEIGLQIAVRGRMSNLAELLEALNKAHAVVMCVIGKPAASEEQSEKNVTTAAGGHSR